MDFPPEQLVIFKLGSIEGSLNSIQAQLTANELRDTQDRIDIRNRLDGHDEDIKALHGHKAYLIGAATAISFVLISMKDFLIKWLTGSH